MLLYIEAKGIKAIGYEDSKGFVVKVGSQMFGNELTPARMQSNLSGRIWLSKESSNAKGALLFKRITPSTALLPQPELSKADQQMVVWIGKRKTGRH